MAKTLRITLFCVFLIVSACLHEPKDVQESCLNDFDSLVVSDRDSVWVFGSNGRLLVSRKKESSKVFLIHESNSYLTCSKGDCFQARVDSLGDTVAYQYYKNGVLHRWNDSLPRGVELLEWTWSSGNTRTFFRSWWTGRDTVLGMRSVTEQGLMRSERVSDSGKDYTVVKVYADSLDGRLERSSLLDNATGQLRWIKVNEKDRNSVWYCAE